MIGFPLRMEICVVYVGTLDLRKILESDFYVYEPN